MDRLLIVDDDASILRVLRMRLESENYTVSAASCSEEAQERMTEETFDLAIVDLGLLLPLEASRPQAQRLGDPQDVRRFGQNSSSSVPA